jgi:hypothetical protein
MAYTTREAIEEIYNFYEPDAGSGVPHGSPEDFVDWATRNGYVLDRKIVDLFGACAEGVFDSLEDFADAVFPGVAWQVLVEEGYWQGDYSDMVFGPGDKVFG